MTYTAPTGCPMIVVERGDIGEVLPAAVEVWRNGERVDATADIASTEIYLDVDYYDTCGTTYGVAYVQSERFVHHRIDVSGSQPGDEVVLDHIGTVLIQEAAPCPIVPAPRPECYATRTTPCPELDEHADRSGLGCRTSHGSTGLPIMLALAAMVFRRRRR